MLPTFNRVTKSAYRPAVAKVYGVDRSIPFWRVFKTLEAAERCAARFHGIVFPVAK